MEIVEIKNLKFNYPNTSAPAISDINLTISKGEFITFFGYSGSGKSTLLRLIKPTLAPFGEVVGEIKIFGKDIKDLDKREDCEIIGFVGQNPENQIVTDKVWHELAFGLESLGKSNSEIRQRVSEMASFFGIEDWFHKNTAELSGGEMQILNLASQLVSDPDILVLDEPTSQLDPIASGTFMEMLSRINRELGITVIMSEHRLEQAFAVSDRVIAMDKGRLIADARPDEIGEVLALKENDLVMGLPAATRLFMKYGESGKNPVSIRDGRDWLLGKKLNKNSVMSESYNNFSEPAIKLKDICFRHEKNSNDVLRGLSVEILNGEIFTILGGNGAGKSTLLKVLAGMQKPYRGKIVISGKSVGYLPQNPDILFLEKTVEDELSCNGEIAKYAEELIEYFDMIELLKRHPFDLSGGEKQRLGIIKILLKNTDIILLDEPTKGMDARIKEKFEKLLKRLKTQGKTIVIVSHDIEFSASVSDRCALIFDGEISSVATPREFFAKNRFYTTAAARIAKGIIDGAIFDTDILDCMEGNV